MALLLRSSSPFGRRLASATLRGLGLPAGSSHKKFAGFACTMMVGSGSTSPSSRRPLLPRAENDRPTTLICDRLCCTNISRGKKLELKYAKHPSKDFCSFMEDTSKAEIVAFFRDITRELEGNQQIWDFHMKILDGEGDFRVEIYYGVEKSGPALLPLADCISCYSHVPLYPEQEPGMEAGECVLEEFSDQPYAVCRLDAQGRCGFVITPVRHVERMSELDDEELFGLWSLAVRALRHAELPFTSMILNHGTYRNVEHLHLKVWVDKDLHQQYRTRWSEERQELWKRLQELSMRHRKKRVKKKM